VGFVVVAARVMAACAGDPPPNDAGPPVDRAVPVVDMPVAIRADVPRPSGTPREITWLADAMAYRSMVGQRAFFHCPPKGTYGLVFGTAVYADHSSICTAAAHDRRITVREGGDVEIRLLAGQATYMGSTGGSSIMSGDWKRTDGAYEFTFPARKPVEE
jgi:hypothetical protein